MCPTEVMSLSLEEFIAVFVSTGKKNWVGINLQVTEQDSVAAMLYSKRILAGCRFLLRSFMGSIKEYPEYNPLLPTFIRSRSTVRNLPSILKCSYRSIYILI